MHASTRSFPLVRAVHSGVFASVLLMLPTLAASAPVGAPRDAPESAPVDAPESYTELRAQAEAEREVEDHAQAAALWSRAYRSRPEPRRADETGEITLRAALADFQLALEQAPEDVSLLRAQADLVREFVEARTPENSPEDIVDALAELDARLAALEARATPPDPGGGNAIGASEVPEPSLVITPTSRPSVEPGPTPDAPLGPHRPRKQGRSSSRRVGQSLVGLGVTSLAAGAAGLATGGWVLAQTHRLAVAYAHNANVTIAAAEGTERTDAQRQSDRQDIDAYIAALDEFKRDSNRNAIALVVGGSLLAAAGIGLTSWGIVRLRADRRRKGSRAALAPALTGRFFGVYANVVF